MEGRKRCFGDGDPLLAAYHDEEWGVPVHDDRALFEHLSLDIFQAGLSWRLILHRREGFRRAFHGFEMARVARMGPAEVGRLLQDPGIIRNRAKIEATIANARAALDLVRAFGSLDAYFWRFTEGRTLKGPPARSWTELPTTSPEAVAMAGDLKARGFRFVGPTICYAFMQAVGMVDDHLVDCFRYRPAEEAG